MLKPVLWNLFATSAYWCMGRVGLLLSIENGYASPIWPPAGIALALMLLSRGTVVPGIFLGAFLTNSDLALIVQNPALAITQSPQNLLIAAGNTSQAVIGVFLLRKFGNFPNDLCLTRDILRFYVLAGPVACITAALIGTSTLLVNKVITVDSYWGSAVVWWIGDTNGVLIFTPLLIGFSQWRKSPGRFAALSGSLLLCFVVTFIFSVQAQAWQKEKLSYYFKTDFDQIVSSVERCLLDHAHTLQRFGGYLEFSDNISKDLFDRIAQNELVRVFYIAGLSWNPFIQTEEIPEFEAAIRDAYPQLKPKFRPLDPASGPFKEHAPILYVWPLKSHENALGVDLWTEATRREAMIKARSLKALQATAPLNLIQDRDKLPATILYYPVFKDNELRGFATAIVRIKHLMEFALGKNANNGLRIRLWNTPQNGKPSILYQVFEENTVYRDVYTLSKSLLLGGQKWKIDVTVSDEFINRHSDKTAWLLLLSGCLLAAVLGLLILTITGREIVTKRHIEERTRELELANQAKSGFLAHMSHEIRTPMNGIIATADLLQETSLSQEQKEYAQIIASSGSALLVIINDILDFSKIEAGKLELELVPFDPIIMFEEVGDLIGTIAYSKNLELAFVIDHCLPTMLIGDSGRLRQILLNLLNNAVKFTQEGRVTAFIRVEGQKDGQTIILFEISDTGPGIPPHIQSELFMPFRQGDASTTRRHGGTGLGLVIAKQLAEKMGGTISISSVLGMGSTFALRVPFSFKQDMVITPICTGNVLVVSPSAYLREEAAEQFLALGADPFKAANKTQAFDIFKSEQAFHIRSLFLDLTMDYEELLQLINYFESNAKHELKIYLAGTPQQRHLMSGFMGRSNILFLSRPIHRSSLLASLVQNQVFRNPFPAKSTGDFEFPSLRILLVEDNRTNQKVATFLLKKLMLSCDIASNGVEAVSAFKKTNYDLILMDCQMPEMDGFEATRVIRSLESAGNHVPIIAMTANAVKGDREKCLEVGMDEYLSKPVKFDILRDLIKKVMKNRMV